MQMIRSLGNTLLSHQQMPSQQVVHITLSLPLNSSSREFIFINTSLPSERTFLLKPPFLLKQEPDNSKDVMCHSIIDYFIECPSRLRHIFLVDFVSNYMKNGQHISEMKKSNITRFVKYNKHIDYENIFHENIFLYVPFEEREDTLKHGFATWEVAYVFY